MSQSELNPARNEHHRLWTQYNRESIMIILIAICCVITADNHFRTSRTIDVSSDSNNRLTALEGRFETELQRMALEFDRELRRSDEQWSVSYSEMDTECRLWQNDVQGYVMAMNAAGIEISHGPKQ